MTDYNNYDIIHTDALCSSPTEPNHTYNMLLQLTKRLQVLESDHLDMKNTIQNLNNTIDYLNNTIHNFHHLNKGILHQLLQRPLPSILFNDWVNIIIQSVESKLLIVFQYDLNTAIISLFQDSFDNFDNLPIIAFNRKHNLFYYNDSSWVILNNTEINKLFARIDYWFLSAFNNSWYKLYADKIKTSEEYKDLYNSYYFKILGSGISDESRYNKLRLQLYKIFKQ
jgi:hypothetical protein